MLANAHETRDSIGLKLQSVQNAKYSQIAKKLLKTRYFLPLHALAM